MADAKKDTLTKQAIDAFRKKHIKELETNMAVAVSIRDDVEASPRDRNEAIKTISRMLGALQPDRQTLAKKTSDVPELTADDQADIAQHIKEVLGG